MEGHVLISAKKGAKAFPKRWFFCHDLSQESRDCFQSETVCAETETHNFHFSKTFACRKVLLKSFTKMTRFFPKCVCVCVFAQ